MNTLSSAEMREKIAMKRIAIDRVKDVCLPTEAGLETINGMRHLILKFILKFNRYKIKEFKALSI